MIVRPHTFEYQIKSTEKKANFVQLLHMNLKFNKSTYETRTLRKINNQSLLQIALGSFKCRLLPVHDFLAQCLKMCRRLIGSLLKLHRAQNQKLY